MNCRREAASGRMKMFFSNKKVLCGGKFLFFFAEVSELRLDLLIDIMIYTKLDTKI